jgi:hypothetical protein
MELKRVVSSIRFPRLAMNSYKCVLHACVCVGLVLGFGVRNAGAVQVSATYSTAQAGTNHMNLPPLTTLLDPTPPDYGIAGLPAPAVGTSTDTLPFAYPPGAPTPPNFVQMYGDAISSITAVGAGAYDVELTLTNFWFEQGITSVASEYVYLNVWEQFTGLGTAAAWTSAGVVSVTGIATLGAGHTMAIEPIVTVYDPTSSTWVAGSTFFGAGGNGASFGISDSTAVFPLSPYISGGQLSIGMQTILLLRDPTGAGGGSIHLPTSLHLKATIRPVPEPSTLRCLALAIGWGLASSGRRAKRD